MFLGLVEMTFGLVYANFSLPEWQALQMTFFAPCLRSVKPGLSDQISWPLPKSDRSIKVQK